MNREIIDTLTVHRSASTRVPQHGPGPFACQATSPLLNRAGQSENKFIKAWNREAKEGPLEIESGSKPRTSGHGPLLPWVQVSLGPFVLRIEEAKYTILASTAHVPTEEFLLLVPPFTQPLANTG